jgi:hypothetical protein
MDCSYNQELSIERAGLRRKGASQDNNDTYFSDIQFFDSVGVGFAMLISVGSLRFLPRLLG